MRILFFLFLLLLTIASTCDRYEMSVTNKTANKVYYQGGFGKKISDTILVINHPSFIDYVNSSRKEKLKLGYYNDVFKDLYLIVFWVDSITKSRYSDQEIMQRRLYSLDIYTAPELINADYTINYPR